MKKAFAFLLLLLTFAALAGCDFYGVTTTTTPPVRDTVTITTVADLVAMTPGDDYVLAADLDLEGLEWVPVGTPDEPFDGDFDGGGHTIANFTITQPNAGFLGFFGSVTGDLSDVVLTGFTIAVSTSGILYAGGLVAHTTGSVAGVTVEGAIVVESTDSSVYAGLLAGYAAAYTTATMTVSEFVPSTVSDSRAEGTLEATAAAFAYVGGLIGKAYNIVLTDAGARVDLEVEASVYRVYAGGLVGHSFGGLLKPYADRVEDAVLETERCYASGIILFTSNGSQASVGGLYGYVQDGALIDCFANVDITSAGEAVYVGGLAGEVWYGSIGTSVASVGLGFASGVEGASFSYGGIAGLLAGEPLLSAVYRDVLFTPLLTNTFGETVTAADLATTGWYETTLLWSAAAVDLDFVVEVMTETH